MNTPGLEVLKKVNGAREALIVSLGIFIVDSFAHNAAAVSSSAGIAERTLDAIPSAFVAPELSDDVLSKPVHQLDVAFDASTLSAAVIISRQTSSLKEMAAVSLTAQVLSSVADGAAADGRLLSKTEMSQQDVGSSAITSALITKYLLDKRADAPSEKQRRAWSATTGLFLGSVTLGAAMLDRKNGTTDLISHSVGALTGAIASSLRHPNILNDDSAAKN